MGQRAKVGPLSGSEEAAWRALVRAMNVLPRLIEADLMRSSRLNLADYTVMAKLSEAPNRSMRMNDLANEAALSASGLTRVVERMVRLGAVERARCPVDGRGQVAMLTETGFACLGAAYPYHVESVRRRVLDHFNTVNLDALEDALNAIGADENP